ncbi:MAG: hypothetical protein ACJ701_09025 [Nitrososphaera sp.]
MKDKQKQIAISVGKIQSEFIQFQVQKEECVTVTTDDRRRLLAGRRLAFNSGNRGIQVFAEQNSSCLLPLSE